MNQKSSVASVRERGILSYRASNISGCCNLPLGMPVGCHLLEDGRLLIGARDFQGNCRGFTVDISSHDILRIGWNETGELVIAKDPDVRGWIHVYPSALGLIILDLNRCSIILTDADGQTVNTYEWRDNNSLLPWSACRLADGGVAIGDWSNHTIHYFSPSLELLGSLPASDELIVEPRSLDICPDGNLLVADGSLHQVCKIARSGEKVWEYGTFGLPGSDLDELCNPWSAKIRSDGIVLIADTRNHRIIGVDPETRSVVCGYGSYFQGSNKLNLCTPTDIAELPDGHLLICDAGNSRIIRVAGDGEIVWICGSNSEKQRMFSFPRSVTESDAGALMVADTYNNRVIEISSTDQVLWELTDSDISLYWPRCARVYDDQIVIADGRGGCVLCVGRDKNVLWSIKEIRFCDGHGVSLSDPHDVSLNAHGRVLITDAGLNAVMEVDTAGNVFWYIDNSTEAIQLRDPHTAQYMPDNNILICDSGNGRIVIVDPENQRLIWDCSEVCEADGTYKLLRAPKHCFIYAAGIYLVTESNTARIMAIDEQRRVLWSYQPYSQDKRPPIAPRWCEMLSDGTAVMSDYFGCRLLSFDFAHNRIARAN